MATGMRTRATDTTIQRRVVTDLIRMIDWTEAPLIQLLGLDNQNKFRMVNFPSHKIEWLEDTMSPREDTLAAAVADGTTTSVTVSNGGYFKTGDIIGIDSELMYVSSVSGNTLTVVRGHGGTTAAAHSNGANVYLRTVARLEGSEATTGHTTTVSNPYNFSQILEETVKVSGTQQAISDYGVRDTLAYHLTKLIGGGDGVGGRGKAGKLVILLAQTFYYGYRQDELSGLPRAMGGFNQFVTTNVTNKSGSALSRKDIDDVMQACFLAGGSPDTIVTGAWGLRKITQFFEGAIRTERSESRGGANITRVVTQFGELEVVFDRWCPNNELYIIEKNKMGWVPIRPFGVRELPSTGDYEWSEVLGEYSFVLCNEKAHGKITGFSTSK